MAAVMVDEPCIQPTCCNSGPARSLTAAPTPNSSSCAKLPAVRHSPHTFCRDRDFVRPGSPASPPARGEWRLRRPQDLHRSPRHRRRLSLGALSARALTDCQKCVRKGPGVEFIGPPAVFLCWPPDAYLVCGKARRNALDCIFAGNRVCSQEAHQMAGYRRKRVPARLDSNDRVTPDGDAVQQSFQRTVTEVVQEQSG